MMQAVATRQTEGTPAVISSTNYVPQKDDFYGLDGCVECICGYTRYHGGEACKKCKSFEIAAYRVSEEARHLIASKTAVKTRFWYHSTSRLDWDKEIKDAGVSVHLGDLSSAHERAEHEYDGGNGAYTVYKILLNPFASISDVVCPDLINGWSESMDDFRRNADADFVRYVNTAESVGSISLIGDPKKFIIVEKTSHNIHY